MGRLAVVGAIGVAACGRIGFDDHLTPDVADQLRASITVAEATACAIRDGDVYCWGHNGEGQLGPDAPSSLALRPVRVTTIPKAVKIAAAVYHVCMVSDEGEVWCWGGNELGRLGIPSQGPGLPGLLAVSAVPGGPATAPVRVQLPGPAIDVSVSNSSSCAVLATGEAWCWGGNNTGQLGRGTSDGDNGAENLPAAVMNLSDARRISLDHDSTCALRTNGDVVCWGENGRGLIDTSGMNRTVPTAVTGFANATAIAVGGDRVCAVMEGRVGCRGAGSFYELGNGSNSDSATVVYTSLDDAVELEAAFAHTCAVRENGAVACWGWNDYYVLGTGSFFEAKTPAPVEGIDNAIAVSAGNRATCAIREDGDVSCWGYGARGLLGDGRSAESSARRVTSLAGASIVAVGRDHTCVSDTTDVSCWGSNRFGQLGLGTATEPHTSPQVLSFAWPSGIAELVAGDHFTCVRLADGSVHCWGYNGYGELGIGNTDHQKSPMLVTLPPAADLVAGLHHVCSLGTDRNVWCWGYNGSGQLGDGTQNMQPTPVMVATNVDAIAAGEDHTCTLAANTVACWGDNNAAQLGDGTTATMRPTAAPISGGLMVNAIRAGGDTTCVLTVGNAVACWGLNDSNVQQVAGGGMYVEPLPIVSTQPLLFSLGGWTGCVGTTCWGRNGEGQAGVGNLDYNRGQPEPVIGLPPGATTFAISATHTCAVGDGNTHCWGENASGEIGVGTKSVATSAETTVAFP